MISPTDPPHRAAVSVVVLRGDEVLLVRRGRPPNEGRFAPVGGRVEPGESLEAAALREVREETGVGIELSGRCGAHEIRSRDHDGAAVVWDLTIFAARHVGGDPIAGDDAAEACFVPLADLARLDLVDGAVEAIEAARRLLDGAPAEDPERPPV